MGFDLRFPHITGATPGEKVTQINNYLYQLVEQLQWALNNINTTEQSDAVMPMSLEQDDASTTFATDTGWVSRTMSDNASEPSTVARGGWGCFYRVINNNHVFVRFNCAFTFNGSSINLNSATIPQKYRPKNNAYGLFPINDRAIARASVASDGYIYVDDVQNMATASTTTSFNATWIDGYIDYWI